MNNNIISIIIAVCYLGIKLIENKFLVKDDKPIKLFLRDALIVYISSMCSFFIYSQIEPITENINSAPNVFTSDPDF